MNKGYIYIDGKVVISDENGNHTQSEYYDNLDRVLVKENIIEEMEGRIQELTIESEKYPETKKRYIPYCLYVMLGGILAIPPLVLWAITGTNPYLSNIGSIFGSVNPVLFLTLVTGVVGLPIGSLYTLIDYSNFKERVNRGKGINSELEFLKLQIEKEKEDLASLQKEKTRDNENKKFRTVKVDDKKQLEALRSYLELYYDLGSNREKYYRYYQQGKLDKKLQKNYNETGIELAKEYLEEKGPMLVQKKK